MANPTTLVGEQLATIEASDTPASIALDGDSAYLIQHTGLATDGTTATTNTVLLGADLAVADADLSAAAKKFPLLSGGSVVVGPGIARLHFVTAAGSPVIALSKLRQFFGQF